MKRVSVLGLIRGVAVVPLILLYGCVSAPAPKSSTAFWAPPARGLAEDSAWKTVRARPVDSSQPLTLAELANLALQNNPASAKAWYDARVAAEQVKQAEGYFLPTLAAAAGINRQHTTAEPDSFNQDYWKFNPGLQMNYLVISFGGGRQAAVEAALQTVYSANFTFNRAIQNELFAVESAYYDVISAQAAIAAAESSAKDAKATRDAAQARQDAGLGTKLDVLQAQAGYDQSLYNLAGARGQLKIARGNLAQAVGISAEVEIKVVEPALEVPGLLGEQDMRRMIDEALRRRPDLAALRATVAAKEATAKAIGAPLWPSLYVNGSMNRDYYDNITGKNLQNRDWSLSGGLSLQWTLFDGMQTLSARRAALALAESFRAQLQQAELAASADVWTRYQNYDTARQKYDFSAALLKSASASYEAAMDSYKAGLTGILDLLNAETRLEQARSQHVATRQEVFTALAGLAYAAGRMTTDGAPEAQGFLSNSIGKDVQP